MAAHDNPSLDLDPRYDHYDYPTTSPEKKSGHPGHTTKEQDAQVHQLRMALEQMGYKDRLDTLTLVGNSSVSGCWDGSSGGCGVHGRSCLVLLGEIGCRAGKQQVKTTSGWDN